jgi:alkanesulfonate monooxygenase
MIGAEVKLFSTCPQSKDFDGETYCERVSRVAHWSEAAGCTGILIYTDNSIADPWLVSQFIMQSTQHLCPLVAVQPIYMAPFTAAKMVASLGFLHRRRIWLNMLAGGFRNDLLALGDNVAHDDRYARTVEYALLMRRLLESDQPVDFTGRFYNAQGLRLAPQLPTELQPGWLMSGSSAAGREAAEAIGAIAVEYPSPADNITPDEKSATERGVRVGIIARPSTAEAWDVAHSRFPADRRGRLTHALAMRTSDSAWHHRLSELAHAQQDNHGPYWLWPFEHHRTFCPYLVGDFATVAGEIGRYLSLGHRTFILDIPLEADDLTTAAEVFRIAATTHCPDNGRHLTGPM